MNETITKKRRSPKKNSENAEIQDLKKILSEIQDQLLEKPTPSNPDNQIFAILKNLRDSVSDNNKIIMDFIKQSNDNIESVRKEVHDSNKENDEKFVVFNDELKRLYEAVLTSISDNKSIMSELNLKISELEKNISYIEDNHCSIEEREIIKQIINEKKEKEKEKKETLSLLKSETLKTFLKWAFSITGLIFLVIFLKWNDIIALFKSTLTP